MFNSLVILIFAIPINPIGYKYYKMITDILVNNKPKETPKPQFKRTPPPSHLKRVQDVAPSGGSRIDFELEVNMRVVHDRFGMGTVKELTGSSSDRKATIAFDNAGEKKLLLKFAKLQRA